MDYLHAGEIERDNSVQDETHKDRDRTWQRWLSWLQTVGIERDPFLDGFTVPQRIRLVGGFAISVRRCKHSHPRYTEPLVAGTIKSTLSHLGAAFQHNDKPDPRHNKDGTSHPHLKAITRSFKKSDPKEKAQKALTPQVLAYLYRYAKDDAFTIHIADLCNGAFFFACRSCEYSKTPGTRRTNIITLRNVIFRKKNRKVINLTKLHKADTVSITFTLQKNEMFYETVTQHRNSSSTQNPVIIWANIYRRVMKIPGATIDTPVNAFYNMITDQTEYITSDQILKSLRWAVDELGEDILGYTSAEIGCHSIRSGAAMSMYLQKIAVFTIMLQGRWCSDAFLRYIRRQVKEFSQGVSEAMIAPETYAFFTVPDTTIGFNDQDPRIPNNSDSLTSSQNGRSASSALTRHHVFE